MPVVRLRKDALVATITGLVAVVGVAWWMASFADRRELLPVVAAAHDLSAPRVLVADDLRMVRVAREALPETALTKRDELIGQTLIRSVVKNEILTTADLPGPEDPNALSPQTTAGQVGVVLPVDWLAGPMPRVKKNDLVTVIAALPARPGSEGSTGILIDRVPVRSVEVSETGAPVALLFDVPSEVAAALLEARVNQYALAVVVGSSRSEDMTSE